MTLDCPGCRSRLKLDPAKLPAGATTAVCPKCKTRILLPNAAAAGDITVQCAGCSARLKVSVAKLKPAVSKSKCPKCGKSVDLPAAPPGAARAAAAQPRGGAQAGQPQRQQAPQQEAMTRRLDPREIGMVLGAGAGTSQTASTAPIQITEPLEQSAEDLSQLINEKVAALDDTGKNRAAAVSNPPPASTPERGKPATPEAEPPAVAGRPKPDGSASKSNSAGDPAMRRSGAGRSSSASRQVPEFGAIASGSGKSTSPAKLLFMLGAATGALVGAAMVLLGPRLPAALIPVAPAVLNQALGESLAPLLLIIILSAIGGMLGGVALPPEGQSGGVSLFRCTVATAMLGLLSGVLFTLLAGPFDIMAVAGWTAPLFVSGLLTGTLGLIVRRRPS